MAGPGTVFTGPVQTGTIWNPGDSRGNANVGLAQLAQTITLTQNGASNVSGILYVPPGSQIDEFNVDNLVLWNSTTAGLTIGTSPGGNQIWTTTSLLAGTRLLQATAGYTATQLTLMQNVGNSPQSVPIYFTVTVTGTASAGTTFITMKYLQTVQLSAGAA